MPRLTVADGINTVRTLFPTMWFGREKCADGLQALRFYRYDVDPNTGNFSRNPLHDSSDGPDALRYVAVAGQAARRAPYEMAPPRPRWLRLGLGRSTRQARCVGLAGCARLNFGQSFG